MKYTIETTETGCIETIELENGQNYFKRHIRTSCGSKSKDDDFSEQMENGGIHDEDFLDNIHETFDGFLALEFMEAAEKF